MTRLTAILPLLVIAALPSKAQDIKPLIDSQTFVFVAQTVEPHSGGTRHLNDQIYSLQVKRDSIVCGLPYFGHTNTAGLDDENVLQFRSAKFKYTVKPGRKEGWKVTIQPKESPEISEMLLTVSPAGMASLQVFFINRDPISYSGGINAPTN
jgi:hypothetical protein